MFWVILTLFFAAIFTTIAVYYRISVGVSVSDKHPGFGSMVFLFMFIPILLCASISVITTSTPEYSDEAVLKSSECIINLKDNRDVHGRFFLYSGRVDTDMYYYYMIQNADGSMQTKKVPAEEASFVYISDDETPYVEHFVNYEIHNETAQSLRFWFTWDWLGDLFFGQGKEERYQTAYYAIHVPQGSITNDFAVDME